MFVKIMPPSEEDARRQRSQPRKVTLILCYEEGRGASLGSGQGDGALGANENPDQF
jgi:hypothetical protein